MGLATAISAPSRPPTKEQKWLRAGVERYAVHYGQHIARAAANPDDGGGQTRSF